MPLKPRPNLSFKFYSVQTKLTCMKWLARGLQLACEWLVENKASEGRQAFKRHANKYSESSGQEDSEYIVLFSQKRTVQKLCYFG